NDKVGGYCTSFERDGFRFDACVHSLEGLGKNSKFREICNELNLFKYLKVVRVDPPDTIFIGEKKISIWNSYKKTECDLQSLFPQENITGFLEFIKKISFYELHKKYYSLTFKDLLKFFFKTKRVISFFDIFFRNRGVPISYISAINSILFLKVYLFDNGYYPIGGMQSLPNAFALRFMEYGGNLQLNTEVSKIMIKQYRLRGIETKKDTNFFAKKIISNSDLTQTLVHLIHERHISEKAKKILQHYKLTPSVFLVYFGFKKSFRFSNSLNTWFFKDWRHSFRFNMIFQEDRVYCDDFLVTQPPFLESHNKVAFLTINAPYISKKFWDTNKDDLVEKLLKNIDKKFKNFWNNVIFHEAATPITLETYTFNRKGALSGLAATPMQITPLLFLDKFLVKNIFFVGHWVPHPAQGGIPAVAIHAYQVAKKIILSSKINNSNS
ncbi:MAG: NAD(P)/FAD-dependent oxidoreductase, partial [Candidatus Omnitrophica bacterium]|nr:NAD(P)/FAD-dependent oxidoreductase [Candidatus Omnitrophota bacterium]